MHDFLRIDAAIIARHISALKASHPELAEDAELLAGTIEGETDFHRVMDKLGAAFLEAAEMKAGAANLSNIMRDRASRFDDKAEALRALMMDLMDAAGQQMVRLPVATVSVRSGVERVVIEPETSLPQGFVKTETTPLRAELMKALKAGETIPGAYLETGPASLQIRVK